MPLAVANAPPGMLTTAEALALWSPTPTLALEARSRIPLVIAYAPPGMPTTAVALASLPVAVAVAVVAVAPINALTGQTNQPVEFVR